MKREPLDAVDAEAMREIIRMRGWKLFLARLRVMRSRKTEAILKRHPHDETEFIRGYIQALDEVLSIPDTIVSEGRAFKDG